MYLFVYNSLPNPNLSDPIQTMMPIPHQICFNSRQLSCINKRHLLCFNQRHLFLFKGRHPLVWKRRRHSYSKQHIVEVSVQGSGPKSPKMVRSGSRMIARHREPIHMDATTFPRPLGLVQWPRIRQKLQSRLFGFLHEGRYNVFVVGRPPRRLRQGSLPKKCVSAVVGFPMFQ